MRDGQIIQMKQDEARKSAILYKQFTFLQTRMQAFEHVLSDRWTILRGIWSPLWLKNEVNKFHLLLLKGHDEMVREVNVEQSKPKINVVSPMAGIKTAAGVVVLAFLFTGCMSKSVYKRDIAKLTGECSVQQEIMKTRYEGTMQMALKDLESKNERLRRFNQIDEHNRLYPLKEEK